MYRIQQTLENHVSRGWRRWNMPMHDRLVHDQCEMDQNTFSHGVLTGSALSDAHSGMSEGSISCCTKGQDPSLRICIVGEEHRREKETDCFLDTPARALARLNCHGVLQRLRPVTKRAPGDRALVTLRCNRAVHRIVLKQHFTCSCRRRDELF